MKTFIIFLFTALLMGCHASPATEIFPLSHNPLATVSKIQCSGFKDGDQTRVSGSAIVTDSIVITAAHIVRACNGDSIRVIDQNRNLKASYVNDAHDLAVLGPLTSLEGLSCDLYPQDGALLHAVGHPQASDDEALFEGFYVEKESNSKTGTGRGYGEFGMSGGAVFDESFKTVGMFRAITEDHKSYFFVKMSFICRELGQLVRFYEEHGMSATIDITGSYKYE